MTITDTHLLIRVERDPATGAITESRMGAPASWANCQLRWSKADAERIVAGISVHQLHFKVRHADDPAVRKLMPTLYVSQLHAAQALARKAGLSRWRLMDKLLPDVRAGGWWSIARELSKAGYIGHLADGRCYLTDRAVKAVTS